MADKQISAELRVGVSGRESITGLADDLDDVSKVLTGELSKSAQSAAARLRELTGTLFARVSRLFDQQTWDQSTWADAVDGDPAPATYNASLSPIEVTNLGALTERWVLRFTSSTAFQIIGEHVGNIGTGSTSVDCAPINPIAGVPYFTVRADGWGAGWAVGNIVRLNTVGAIYPFAAIRTVQQGPAAGIDYSFELLGRGDIDRPPSAP